MSNINLVYITLTLGVLAFSNLSSASGQECSSECIEGKSSVVCNTPFGSNPVFKPQVCPIPPPYVRPVLPPYIAPIGTNHCEYSFIYSHGAGKYVWIPMCSNRIRYIFK